MRVDKAPDGGKFRCRASADLDGEAGAWGDGDLLCVTVDDAGELNLATGVGDVDGIILTTEGKKNADAANYKTVVGGQPYTVFFFCELAEAETAASPALAAGDVIHGAANGAVSVAGGAGAAFIGKVLAGGSRVLINVGQGAVGA